MNSDLKTQEKAAKLNPSLWQILRDFTAFLSLRPLIGECRAALLTNPFFWQWFVFGSARLVRRWAIMMVIAMVGFFVSSLFAARDEVPSAGEWLVGFLVIRGLMIWRTAWATSQHVDGEIRSGRLHEIHLTRLTPLEIATGWAIGGWIKTAGESLIVFAVFYPWIAGMSGLATLLPLTGVVTLVMYQALAALIVARMKMDYAQRREAVAAGWITSTFMWPMFIWAAVIAMGLVMLLPVVLGVQLISLGGLMLRPAVDLSRWLDVPMADVLVAAANVFCVAGIFVIYPALVLASVCAGLVGRRELMPNPGGYFEERRK